MKLINKKNKNYTQVFHVFTEEEWTKSNKNFNKNIATFLRGKNMRSSLMPMKKESLIL